MKKQILPLKAVLVDEGLIVRSSGGLIAGFGVRRAKVIPDERGRLGEILRADDPWFEKFGQVYFTTTYPGIVKAWHYHRKQTDHFYVIRGTVKVGLYDARRGFALARRRSRDLPERALPRPGAHPAGRAAWLDVRGRRRRRTS